MTYLIYIIADLSTVWHWSEQHHTLRLPAGAHQFGSPRRCLTDFLKRPKQQQRYIQQSISSGRVEGLEGVKAP